LHILSVDVITPANYWKNSHLHHHSIFGNEDIFDDSNTVFLTKQKYEKFMKIFKILFRILREPSIFFIIFPIIFWWIVCPFYQPTILIWAGHAIKFYLCYTISPYMFFSVYFAAVMGLILFHLQHAANDSYRTNTKDFSKDEGAILGSTYIQIPWPLSYFSLGIEFHHIHHLNTRVPCYRIRACHFDGEHFWDGLVTKITSTNLWESMNLVMWDEKTDKLIPFSKL